MTQNMKRILAREWLWLVGSYTASIGPVVYLNPAVRWFDFDLNDWGFLLFWAAPLGMVFFYVTSGSVRLTVWAIKAVRRRT